MRKTLLYLFLFTLFIPLLISGQFFFPYVFFKGIIFRLIVIFALASLLAYFWKNQLYKIAKNWLIISAFSFLFILFLIPFKDFSGMAMILAVVLGIGIAIFVVKTYVKNNKIKTY